MKVLTRERVVPTISASVSWLILAIVPCDWLLLIAVSPPNGIEALHIDAASDGNHRAPAFKEDII